ncbi:MAG: 4-hydroxy-tetrahydrodipicolinate reductase [Phycisphaerae bacterium]|nr:4-hydroxy-tetrahydrodipicolinate reductase [Phycisphaerae bacterium]
MGAHLLACLRDAPDLTLVAALTRRGHAAVGRDAGEFHGQAPLGVPISDELLVATDVVVDFSNAAGAVAWAGRCADGGIALVSGSTGLTQEQMALLDGAGRRTAVLWSANMSLGANLLMRLAAEAARALGAEYDIELVEQHHHGKRDAPSGTALEIARAICAATQRDPASALLLGRGTNAGPRERSQIGIHALRLGDVIGEHELHFAGPGEALCLRHRAQARETFARGALRAARWIAGKPPGRYSMRDVLGI